MRTVAKALCPIVLT